MEAFVSGLALGILAAIAVVSALIKFRPRPPAQGTIGEMLASLEEEAKALRQAIDLCKESPMALSARAQALVDRITALSNTVNEKITADEAAHDAANAAAVDADDTAIEGALTTLENAVASPPSGDGTPLPPAE